MSAENKPTRQAELSEQTRECLDFTTVLHFFARNCQTAEGKRRLLQQDLLPAQAQPAHYKELNEWFSYLRNCDRLRLPTIPGPELFARSPHLNPYEPTELRVLGRLLQFWRELSQKAELAFARSEVKADPSLWALTDRLGSLFDEDGDWHKNVSPTYARLIGQWLELDQQLVQTMQALMRRFGAYLSESIVFERNHRRVLAVSVNFRGRVKGIMHDYSSSGNTVYLEPEETVPRQSRLTEIESEIKEELWRIRVELSKEIQTFPSISEQICPLLARADMMQALVGTATQTKCQPIQPNGVQRLALWKARHPLLCEMFAEARQQVLELAEQDSNSMVAFTLELSDPTHGLIISGANTGGKTVTLKTTGLLAWMANSGLPVPCDEGSAIPFYQTILADIGDNQSLSHNLSTFASHLSNIKQVLNSPAGEVLVLLDELGSGTDPAEGNALAQAIIEEMCRRQYHLLVTTHQQILCTMALTHPNLDNGSMIFDLKLHQPTYRFTQGVPGRSHALDIARSAGLPEIILQTATQLIDEDMVDIQAAIRTLQLQNKQMEKQKQKLRRDELRLHRRIKEARSEVEAAKRQQTDFKEKARLRLQKEVDKAEQELRQTLQDVSAGKARKELRKFARTSNEILAPYVEPVKLAEQEVSGSGLDVSHWKLGDTVYLKAWRREGKIVNIDRKKIRLDMAGMKLESAIEDVVHLPQEQQQESAGKVTDYFEEDSDLGLAVELRLLGFRVDDALIELDQTIDKALRRDLPFIKVIHGHGRGALKQAVREALRVHPLKTNFKVILDPANDGTTEIKFSE